VTDLIAAVSSKQTSKQGTLFFFIWIFGKKVEAPSFTCKSSSS
jgi:hypothetical protein